jgi:FkbM family methyltransferase
VTARRANTYARACRLLIAHVPGQRRVPTISRLVNLVARALWEIGLRRAPKGTSLRTRLASGAQVELDLSERIQGQAALTGRYEPTLVDSIARDLPPGGTFFDVGANVGLVTFEVVGLTSDRRPQIHAFEPHPDNVAAIRRNLALNPEARVEVVGAAVGAATGSAVLGISPNPNESGWHRIVSEGSGGPAVAGTIDVPVTTVDEHAARHGIEHIDVLKVDVEGVEASVLEGASGLLSRRAIGMVILEISEPLLEATGRDSERVHDTMARHGYRGAVIKSTSPTRMIPKTRHLAPDDVAFRPA